MNVKLHTKLKHVIISYYFSAGWRQAFKSGNIYTLYYVDLFAGDGVCNCNEIDEEIEKYLPDDMSKRTWSPSFFNLMQYAQEADFDLKCIFNDKCETYIKSLLEKVEKEGHSNFIEDFYCGDANIVCENALEKIGRPNKPSLFYIDPLNHTQLNFSTIEKIARFRNKESGRMPELIINFMLNSIFMALKRGLSANEVDSINRFMGTDFKRDDIIRIKDGSEKTHETLLNIYLDKLQNLGYKCNYHLIKSTKNNAPIYYIIFATFSKKVASWYNNINAYVHNLEEDWIKKNYNIKTMSDAKRKGQTFLTDY